MEGMTAFNEYQTSGDIHGKLVELLDRWIRCGHGCVDLSPLYIAKGLVDGGGVGVRPFLLLFNIDFSFKTQTHNL